MFSMHAQIGEDLGRLEHAADAQLVDLERCPAEHGLALKGDASGVGISFPTSTFNRVDFPAPFGPMMA
jgi:hypothetical protein